MSYRKKHVKNNISRNKPRKSIFKRLWFWIVAALLIVIGAVFYFVFFYPGFQIKSIVISGNFMVHTAEVQEVVSDNVNKSIFLVDQNKIRSAILERFPEIEDVNVEKHFFKPLSVEISERQGVGTFCNEIGCFWIDKFGIIFKHSPLQEDGALIIRSSSEKRELSPGDSVVNAEIMGYITKVAKNLSDNFRIDLTEAFISGNMRLNIKTSEGWQIYLDSSADIFSQLIKLDSLLRDSSTLRKNLRYIDLRPKDRAIICDNDICGS